MTTEITLNADEIRMLVQRSGSPEQTSNISNVRLYLIHLRKLYNNDSIFP